MRIHTFLISSALLLSTSLAGAEERQTPRVAREAAASKPAFDLSSEEVKKIVLEAAAAEAADTKPLSEPLTPVATGLADLRFRQRGGLDHFECDAFNCTAYDKGRNALYSIPLDQYQVPSSSKEADAQWLSCQSHNDLLTTFERYDRCRGVSIGLPATLLPFGNGIAIAPQLRL